MKNEFDHNIASKIKHYEEPLDPQAWDQFEPMLQKKKKFRLIWFWIFGVLCAIGLAGALAFYKIINQEETEINNINLSNSTEYVSNKKDDNITKYIDRNISAVEKTTIGDYSKKDTSVNYSESTTYIKKDILSDKEIKTRKNKSIKLFSKSQNKLYRQNDILSKNSKTHTTLSIPEYVANKKERNKTTFKPTLNDSLDIIMAISDEKSKGLIDVNSFKYEQSTSNFSLKNDNSTVINIPSTDSTIVSTETQPMTKDSSISLLYKEKFKLKFGIYPFVGISTSNIYQSQNDSNYNTTFEKVKLNDSLYTFPVQYNFGVLLGMELTKPKSWFGIELLTGIEYNKNEYSVDVKANSRQKDSVNWLTKLDVLYTSLSIPISLRLNFKTLKNNVFYFTAGIKNHFTLSQKHAESCDIIELDKQTGKPNNIGGYITPPTPVDPIGTPIDPKNTGLIDRYALYKTDLYTDRNYSISMMGNIGFRLKDKLFVELNYLMEAPIQKLGYKHNIGLNIGYKIKF